MKNDEKRILKQRCHHLSPVIWIGQNGLSDNVFNEIDQALDSHELIKIKISFGDKPNKKRLAEEICEKMQAELIQGIGNMYSFYRRNPDK